MNEMLLQFIWHQQLFNAWQLVTTKGEEISVVDPGLWNRNQGPDFLHAKLVIGGQAWAGHVELHVRTSEWQVHGHHLDPNYENVILHIVWEDDEPDEGACAVAALKDIVPELILQKYHKWTWKQQLIPCEKDLAKVDSLVVMQYVHSLAEQRMLQKAELVSTKVRALGMDWQEAFWQSLCRSFGHKVNADAFESIAASVPYQILLKLRNHPSQVEALLMGQGGLLRPDTGDAYAKQLFTDYNFLRKKYRLSKSYVPVHFLRMRPVNFPTIRLAQLAMLIHDLPDLFRMVKEWKDPQMIRQILKVGTSDYWEHHYRFNEPSVHQSKLVGDQLVNVLMVNTIIPFIVAYHQHIGHTEQVNHALQWTASLPAEANSIVHAFSKAGVKVRHMKDAQGLLALHKMYCEKSACAECAIGKWHLKKICESHASVAVEINGI